MSERDAGIRRSVVGDFESIVDYFHGAGEVALRAMGVDPARLPPREDWLATMLSQHEASDRETDLFEYMLQKIVTRHLETHFSPSQGTITHFYSLAPLAGDCGVLLSATAHAGQVDMTQAQAAFASGADWLGQVARVAIPWLPPEQCEFSQLDRGLERLSRAVPQIKKNVLNACAQTVVADGVIQEREAELLRAIADALDCPVPPFVQPVNR